MLNDEFRVLSEMKDTIAVMTGHEFKDVLAFALEHRAECITDLHGKIIWHRDGFTSDDIKSAM